MSDAEEVAGFTSELLSAIALFLREEQGIGDIRTCHCEDANDAAADCCCPSQPVFS